MPLSSNYTFIGKGNWSLDATSGSATGGGAISAIVPAGSRVERAYLYETAFTDGSRDGGSVTLSSGSSSVSVSGFADLGVTSASTLEAYRSDVTSFVSGIVGAGSNSTYTFNVSNISKQNIDGYALVIVYSNTNEQTRTISLLDGFSSPSGDSFNLTYDNAGGPNADFSAQLSLGIGFGFQSSFLTGQYSTVTVNNRLLTSSAGGEDDGVSTNGGLITIGGIGDSSDNPLDPTNNATTGARYDDELYDLAKGNASNGTPFITQSDRSIVVNTTNPSNNDNIFFAGFNTSGIASINSSQNDAPVAVNDSGSGFTTSRGRSFTTANVLANDFDPDAGDSFRLTGFDAAGLRGSLTSNGDGTFIYTPDASFTGTDSFTYTIVDQAGLPATARVDLSVSASSSLPATPAISLDASTDSGSQGDLLTNFSQVIINGTADPGSNVSIYDGSDVVGVGVTGSNGLFRIETTVLGDGTHNLTAIATTSAGNSLPSSALDLIVDTVPPAISTTVGFGGSTYKISGTVTDPNAIGYVQLLQDGTVLGNVTPDSDGNFSFSLSGSQEVARVFTVIASDKADNIDTNSRITDRTASVSIDPIRATAAGAPVAGGKDRDLVLGDNGSNYLSGLDGGDTVNGGGGNDIVFGDAGDDWVDGGTGDDQVRGWLGNDTLFGSAGDDQLLGEEDNDFLGAGSGNDALSGGAGRDSLYGEEGNDVLFGNAGDDILSGGGGSDIFVFGRGDGQDVIRDFVAGETEADTIAFNGGVFASFAAMQAASIQNGADVVISYGAGDRITIQNTQLGSLAASNFIFG